MKKTVYDWHRQDTRMTELKDVCVTVAAAWGRGGNNMPYVKETQKMAYAVTSKGNGDAFINKKAHTALSVGGGEPGQGYPCCMEINEETKMENTVVRRLTPLECERLQGFPDGWTDIGEWTDTKGKKHKAADSPRYKALGNSIATPFWFWLLRRIAAQYERPATLGSLFDGIGGFPYCWERCNGRGTAIWASEIEEFPIAVTKVHFPEE